MMRSAALCVPLFVLLLGLWVLPTEVQPHAAGASPGAMFSTIDSLRTQGAFRAALDRLHSVEWGSANDPDVLWRRALLLTDLGMQMADEDEAVATYRRALHSADSARTADSTSAWAHLVTALAAGRLTLHVGRGNRVRQSRTVKRHTERAIALDSTLAPAYHLRGRWHREVADLNFIKRALVRTIYGGLPDASFDRAIQDFKRAIARESKPYNHLELAKTYVEVGRDAAARTELQRALDTSGSPFEAEHKDEARTLLNDL